MNKANVLFIGDGYSSEEELSMDALKVIDEKGVNNGIFSVEPFNQNDNINKFVFHYMYGSAAPKTEETRDMFYESIDLFGDEKKDFSISSDILTDLKSNALHKIIQLFYSKIGDLEHLQLTPF